MKFLFVTFFQLFSVLAYAQLHWQNMDSLFGPLPKSMGVYFTSEQMDSTPFKAWYVRADLRDKSLEFATDTTWDRRFTPAQFFERNKQPLLVVNGTFFSFATNRNLNVVMQDGKLVSHNEHTIAGKGKDTLTYRHIFSGAIGISKKRRADVAWTLTDSASKRVYASQEALSPLKDSVAEHDLVHYRNATSLVSQGSVWPQFQKWKMKTAIGGGPVLLQKGEIKISNNEELKFAGKALYDKHPRTAMGYTADNRLIILVIEGRNKNAGGATLVQVAQILKDLGCVEALNLDGGGSSCLLVNGKETIKPSDPTGQRPVPAVFMIKKG